jgi:hypothetical protein
MTEVARIGRQVIGSDTLKLPLRHFGHAWTRPICQRRRRRRCAPKADPLLAQRRAVFARLGHESLAGCCRGCGDLGAGGGMCPHGELVVAAGVANDVDTSRDVTKRPPAKVSTSVRSDADAGRSRRSKPSAPPHVDTSTVAPTAVPSVLLRRAYGGSRRSRCLDEI